MKIQAKKLSLIPVADKPLSLCGQIQWMSPEAFTQKFGFEFDEKIESEASPSEFSNFRASIEGRLSLSQLKVQLKEIIQNPRRDLALCQISEDVGFGVFAIEDIPKDTVLCFYSGTIIKENKVARSDHAMGIYGSDIAVSTQHHRGISSFFQHLPGIPPFPNKDLMLHVLSMTGQCISEAALMVDEELYSIEFEDDKTRHRLATANIRREYIVHQGLPVICIVTNRDIKAQEQLGLKYAQFLWSRGIVPELFDQSGVVVSPTKYHRTFGQLDFDGFSYTGDLRPFVEQLKRKASWITFKDNTDTERSVVARKMRHELKRVHAITDELYQQRIFNTSTPSIFCPAIDTTIEKLVRKYKLTDQTQKFFEKGLRNATVNNCIDDVKEFLMLVHNIDAVDENPKSNRSALIHAARKGHLECYQLLIDSGANSEIPDATGSSAKKYLENDRLDADKCAAVAGTSYKK